MSNDSHEASLPPFPPDYRASGVLLHVTSLPSPYGVGDVGLGALEWIDLLHEAGQGWWQSLPMGPTGYGNSPYQPLSSFAGNSLLVSPDWLIEDGLLSRDDCTAAFSSETAVDYNAVIPYKHQLLEQAWRNFSHASHPELGAAFEQFREEQSHWLDDYALFRALKAAHNGACYIDWPAELVHREPASLAQAKRDLADEILAVSFAQFLLFRQAMRLKDHAHSRGIRLIGDLPFFVSPDSSDVWANPELFLLDANHNPQCVAGVPPDYFSPQGQLWGNPVYNWDTLKSTGYRWCIDRMRALLAHVDAIRLDHFRGFAAAWHVPAGAETAQAGHWVPGPGADFFNAVQAELGAIPFIAEDLGMITPDVYALRDQFDIPGTRVLQFAFDGSEDNPYLPRNYIPNTVVYTGTHDNPPSREWYEELSAEGREHLQRCLGGLEVADDNVAGRLVQMAWSSVAGLAIAPLQDLLNLGAESRMNVPGRAGGNWAWRCTDKLLGGRYLQSLAELTDRTNRRTDYTHMDLSRSTYHESYAATS